jgi:hypothetical protein
MLMIMIILLIIIIIIIIIHLVCYSLGNSTEPVMGKHSKVNTDAKFKCTYICIYTYYKK